MSEEIVSMKGTQDGLILTLNENAGLSEILSKLEQKLIRSKGFFDGADVTLYFAGKELSNFEKHEVLEVIRKHSEMNILSVADDTFESKIVQPSYQEKENMLLNEVKELKKMLAQSKGKEVEFHGGTLRSGQSISATNSLVVLGDVNNGAQINAGGSVIILGKLRGVVNCGLSGNTNSFIFALEMSPTLLQINNVYGRFDDSEKGEAEPMIAFVDKELIAIAPISNGISEELKL